MGMMERGTIIIEEIRARMPHQAPAGELIELPEQDRLAWKFVEIYDAIKQAQGIIEARIPKGQRTLKAVFKWIERGIIIAAWLAEHKII